MAQHGSESDRPPVRASDGDRQRVADLLRQHTTEGRLTIEEYEQRVDAAYAARTVADLRPLLADLPVRLDEVLPSWQQPPAVVPHQAAPAAERERPVRVQWAVAGVAVVVLGLALVMASRGGIVGLPLLLLGILFFSGGGRRRHH